MVLFLVSWFVGLLDGWSISRDFHKTLMEVGFHYRPHSLLVQIQIKGQFHKFVLTIFNKTGRFWYLWWSRISCRSPKYPARVCFNMLFFNILDYSSILEIKLALGPRRRLIIFTINLVYNNVKYSHCNFPEPKVMSSNCFFCLKPKDSSFTVINGKEKQLFLTSNF